MENFSLWNLSEDPRARRVTFYATSLGLQQINRGTRAMLDEMLRDLGFTSIDIDDWALTHMATDYLSDYRESDDWRDRWMDTWAIEIHLANAVELPERRRQTPTLASDKTWEGEERDAPWALVVADCRDDDTLARMKAALKSLGHSPREGQGAFAKGAVGLSGRLARELSDELKTCGENHDASPISFKSSPAADRQLLILMPADRAFFESGARLAVLIEMLAEQLGGSTYWRDTMATRSDRED